MQRFPFAIAVLVLAACQPRTPAADNSSAPPGATGPAVGTTEWKIQAYSSAAPPAIAANATILDWNDSLKAPAAEIRQGSNGWTCLPLSPPPAGGYTTARQASPMCADSMTMAWAQGYMTKSKPRNTSLGVGYMLQGDAGASNTDPYAMAAASDSAWVVSGPHVMVFPANADRIKDFRTDHQAGAPFQMWKGTPYAHIMIPVAGSATTD
ncbi:MAG TPA: hypothetical protein VFO96_12790 [Gemmatimonadales bacterium]|nr:hypothetical protein [Gemmatimonadales bacterium]